MKSIKSLVIAACLLLGMVSTSFAQNQEAEPILYKIIKQNGASFVGEIISRDAREILLRTDEIGLVYIPKHEIAEIAEIYEGEREISGGLFASRYFLTTNGFNIDKGDNYVQWNLFGPDFQFGVADNFTMGVMTSWVGLPIIGTTKYSKQFGEKLYGGVGFLGGTGSWAFPKYGLALPFGFVTAGDPVNNVNFTAGYGFLFTETGQRYTITGNPNQGDDYYTNGYTSEDYVETDGRFLVSLAAMFRINDKFSFVFDSFIMLPGKGKTREYIDSNYNERTGKATWSIRTDTQEGNSLIVLAPGLRFQSNATTSFQFGFTGLYVDGEFLPVPIPMIQLFKRI